LSRKFFTLLFTPTLGQLGGTAWDSAIAWFSIDCNGILGFVPKVFHLIVCTYFGTVAWDNLEIGPLSQIGPIL
jgi:hypothetical protein